MCVPLRSLRTFPEFCTPVASLESGNGSFGGRISSNFVMVGYGGLFKSVQRVWGERGCGLCLLCAPGEVYLRSCWFELLTLGLEDFDCFWFGDKQALFTCTVVVGNPKQCVKFRLVWCGSSCLGIVFGHFGYGHMQGGADGGYVVILCCLKKVWIRLACEVTAVSLIFCSLFLIGVECHRWFGTDIPTLHRGYRSLEREGEIAAAVVGSSC